MATPRDSSPPVSSPGDTIDDNDKSLVAAAEPQESVGKKPQSSRPRKRKAPGGDPSSIKKRGPSLLNDSGLDATEDEGSVISKGGKNEEGTPDPTRTVGTAVGFRRQANGTVGSVYSGSKIRHIKKEDGTPLWRKEIQYEFLRLVIEDTKPVFTRFSDGKKDCNFADIYIDCLIQSSKTSKILKERLGVDRQAAQNMAMICLLVNVGRMNTTLNFFPEMRAQLRTYHSIPSLQAYKSQKDYKSLQDAPRLKSILKGASEDDEHPRFIEMLQEAAIPRTNAVNLIFIISQYAPRISEAHFLDKVDFFDLTMRSTISSKSRARAFLWLMWWYLESNFSRQDALNNPFGAGSYPPEKSASDPEAVPTIVPELEHLSPEEGDAENVDPPEEIEFAEKMTKERKRIMEMVANEPDLKMADPGNPENKSVKRIKKNAAMYGDEDSTAMSDLDSRASPGVGRSPAPVENVMALNSALGAQADSLEDDFEMHDPHPGRGRYKRVRGKNTPSRAKGNVAATGSSRKRGGADTPEMRATPQPLQPGTQNVISQYGSLKQEGGASGAKPRARTGYQRELEEHKQKRIEWALRRRRKHIMAHAARVRQQSGMILRTARRVSDLDPTYDSEEEGDGIASVGLGGLIGRVYVAPDDVERDTRTYETEDWGEEAESWLRVTKRIKRRLQVWDGERDLAIYYAQMQRAGRGRDLRPEMMRDVSNETGDFASAPLIAKSDDPGPKTKREMDAQIEMDLLAERSDEEMADTPGRDDGDADVEGDGEGSDVAMD